MKNLSLRAKLFLVLGMLSAVSVVIAFLGINKLGSMNDRLNDVVNVAAEKVKLGARIDQDLLKIRRDEKNIILATTAEEIDKYADSITRTLAEMQDRRRQLRELVDNTGRAMLDEFAAKWDQFLDINRQVIKTKLCKLILKS